MILLLPPVRRGLAAWLRELITRHASNGHPARNAIIEVEVLRAETARPDTRPALPLSRASTGGAGHD